MVKATISPSGGSALVSLIFVWGILDYLLVWNIHVWTNERMGSTTIILPHIHHNYHINHNRIVYQKWVLPDLIVVKHERKKFIPEHTKRKVDKDWYEYKV